MSNKDVLIIGPGFIGWTILRLLVAENYTVTCFCRRKEHGEALTKDGASRIVLGDLHDHDLIAKEAAAHSIIFHTATADDLPSVKALLDGIRQRTAAGLPALYIHTSGTSVLDDKSGGMFRGSTVYTDESPEQMDKVDNDAPHREIDLAIVRAMREEGVKGKAKMAIMVPPEIYGYNKWNGRLTVQLPDLTRFALKHGYAGYVGKGAGIESCIHVNDLARGYIVLLVSYAHSEIVLDEESKVCTANLRAALYGVQRARGYAEQPILLLRKRHHLLLVRCGSGDRQGPA